METKMAESSKLCQTLSWWCIYESCNVALQEELRSVSILMMLNVLYPFITAMWIVNIIIIDIMRIWRIIWDNRLGHGNRKFWRELYVKLKVYIGSDLVNDNDSSNQ